MKIKFFLSDNEMAPTTISDNLFADSLINRGYNVEKVISYKRKKEIIEKEDADIIIFQKNNAKRQFFLFLKNIYCFFAKKEL